MTIIFTTVFLLMMVDGSDKMKCYGNESVYDQNATFSDFFVQGRLH